MAPRDSFCGVKNWRRFWQNRPTRIQNPMVGTDPASFGNFAGLVADLSGEALMSVAGAVRLG
jgi:hypothetical protein